MNQPFIYLAMAKVYPFRYPESKGKICFARQNLTKLLSADFILYSRNKKCTIKCLNLYPGYVAFLVPTTKSKINLVEPNLDYAVFTLAYHHNLYPYSNVFANRINNSRPKSDPRKYF